MVGGFYNAPALEGGTTSSGSKKVTYLTWPEVGLKNIDAASNKPLSSPSKKDQQHLPTGIPCRSSFLVLNQHWKGIAGVVKESS